MKIFYQIGHRIVKNEKLAQRFYKRITKYLNQGDKLNRELKI